MENFIEIIITALFSTLSALIVFYFSERIKNIKKSRMMFKKLGMDLYEMLMLLMMFESSCKQFIEISKKYSLGEVGSIGFPRYIFPLFKNNIPNTLYYNNGKILQDVLQLNKVSFSLNNMMKELAINDIKEDLIRGGISIEQGKERYKQEVVFLSAHLNNTPDYISFLKKLYANILLINSYQSFFSFISLKFKFTDIEIDREIKQVNVELNKNMKIDEYPLD